jgi:hypothetical protein
MGIPNDSASLWHVSKIHDVNLILSREDRRVPLWLTLVGLNCVTHLRIIPRLRMSGDLFQRRLQAPIGGA